MNSRSRTQPLGEDRPRRRLPWPIRFLASLQLAVVLITVYAVVLIWAATIIERNYGHDSRAVFFGVYRSWWFGVLNLLLAVNVAMSALVRLPWKRRHVGFLVTHAGILVLMAGFAVGHFWGIESQLNLFEGNAEHRALNAKLYLRLAELPGEGGADKATVEAEPRRVVEIPFRGGPFNWEAYSQLPYLPWHLARRDRGTVYDRDGVRLEVLDYRANAEQMEVPRVQLAVTPGVRPERSLVDAAGETVELVVRPTRNPHGPGRRELAGGQRVIFGMAASQAEIDAMLDSAPEGPIGANGLIVLHAGGRKFSFSIDQLQAKRRQPLGDTGLEVELVQFIPQLLAASLQVHRGEQPPRRLMLLADFPELNQYDAHNGVYGVFYFDPDAERSEEAQARYEPRILNNARRARIELVQGPDRRLYWRAWRPPDTFAVGQLATGGEATPLLANTPEAMTIRVRQFDPADGPGTKWVALPFNRKLSPGERHPQVQLRLTVDGRSEEFWIAGLPYGMADRDDEGRLLALPPDYRRDVAGDGRRIATTMAWGDVELGFDVYLQRFDRKLDPGADTVSHYASVVDFLRRDPQRKPIWENVLITLNAPVDFTDPVSGRSYRFYQSSFRGPFRPGDPQYERYVGDRGERSQLFQSVLSVNFDPGRGLKYFGSMLISVGIVLTYYFRRKTRPPRS